MCREIVVDRQVGVSYKDFCLLETEEEVFIFGYYINGDSLNPILK
jgi:hypothetical protein